MLIIFFAIEGDNPRSGSSLLLFVMVLLSIAANFALMFLYLSGRPKLSEFQKEEWIWVRKKITKKIGNVVKTTEVITEIQRKEIEEIEKDPEIIVTELVEVATTMFSENVYIEYVEKKHKEEEIEKFRNDHLINCAIETSEEDESATKDTIEIEATIQRDTTLIQRIKISDLEQTKKDYEAAGETVTVVVRDTKEDKSEKKDTTEIKIIRQRDITSIKRIKISDLEKIKQDYETGLEKTTVVVRDTKEERRRKSKSKINKTSK